MPSIQDLEKMTKDELLVLWRKLPDRQPPPARIDRLLRELAYRLQEQRFGRLDKNTTVSLRRHMTEFGKSLRSKSISPPAVNTPPEVMLESGSVLTREWDGKRITVQIVGPRNFIWEGQAFKSLSSLARKITGQHLSGPLFFGLKEVKHG